MRNNILISTVHGTMLVNRHELGFAFGVCKDLIERGVYEPREVVLEMVTKETV